MVFFVESMCFCFVVAILDLVHDVEDLFNLPNLLTAFINLFQKYKSLIFQKKFPDAISNKRRSPYSLHIMH